MSDNAETLKSFKDMEKQLMKYSAGEVEMTGGMSQGIRLAKTAKGARTNARIEASQKKEFFDETETLIEELATVEQDIITEMIKRTLDDIFGT